MNLRTVLTATWLCIVAVVYLSLYFVCHAAHSKFAGIIAAAGTRGKRNKSGSVQDLNSLKAESLEIIQYVIAIISLLQ